MRARPWEKMLLLSVDQLGAARARGDSPVDYEVIVVGAGPAGLACAIELGSRGIKCLLVERNARVGYAPRAKTTNVRTRTHLRRWGIAESLAEASPFGIDYPSDVLFLTRLAGPELARFTNAFNAAPARDPRYPEHAQWVPQYKLEEVLRTHAAHLASVTIAFDTMFIDATERDGKVSITLQDADTGDRRKTQAYFVVGADGARSRVRDVIGATMAGTYGLSRNYNIIFRAPGLAQAHRHGPAIMYWQVNADAPSLIGPMDRDDIWFFMPTDLAEGQELSDEEAIAMIARSTGIDLPYEILSSDVWIASRLIADKYRLGKMFLIGDACHLHPPFGGYGMNMGVADGVDLGWKLAAELQGWGGEVLLDSYEAERRPVHEFVMDEAVANHAVLGNQLWVEGLENDDASGFATRLDLGKKIAANKIREFDTLGAVLGYRYTQSPVIPEAVAVAADSRSYHPSSEPGALAAHAWLGDGRSLYDCFGAGFTLFTQSPLEDDVLAARAEANEHGIPLSILALPCEVPRELYPCALTLVRPDQHVAWRGDTWKKGALLAACGLAETKTTTTITTGHHCVAEGRETLA